MKFVKKTKDGKYHFSFDQVELKDVYTSLDLIYKGMPETDLGLTFTRNRLKKMLDIIKQKLQEAALKIA